MRILWIGPWRADALSTQARGSMAQALHDVGNQIGTVVIGEQGSWKTGGYDWVRYCPTPRTPLGKWRCQVPITRVIAEFNGDVLVLGEKAAQLAPVAAALRKCFSRQWKIVIDVRTLPIPSCGAKRLESRARRFWRQLQIGFPFTDAWMAITEGLREEVQKKIGLCNLPCAIWESAVDRRFLDCDNVVPAENIVKCGHDCNILYLGSLEKGRRIDLPIRAMAQLNNGHGKVGLHIVGTGKHLPELTKLIDDLKLNHTVHLWRPVPYSEVPTMIRACQLGILPLPDCLAWNTSSALKIYEYLGIGLPVLVSDIPAHRHAVGGQPFAFFMPEYSIKGYLAALTRFLERSEHDRYNFWIQAREFVRNGHTWDHRAQVIHRFLTTIHTEQN
jgi:glycosyltransferase involved in cell wall biosynthesis